MKLLAVIILLLNQPLRAQTTTFVGLYSHASSPTLYSNNQFYLLNMKNILSKDYPKIGDKIEVVGTLSQITTPMGSNYVIMVDRLTILSADYPLYDTLKVLPKVDESVYGHDGYGVGKNRQENSPGTKPPNRTDPFAPKK